MQLTGDHREDALVVKLQLAEREAQAARANEVQGCDVQLLFFVPTTALNVDLACLTGTAILRSVFLYHHATAKKTVVGAHNLLEI